MSQTHPLSEMLTGLRNALRARKPEIDLPASNLKLEVLQLLKEEGYIGDFKVSQDGPKKRAKVALKFGPGGERVINGLQTVSRPSLRVYAGWRELRPVLGGLGIMVISTPQGLFSDREARRRKLGGEILFKVW